MKRTLAILITALVASSAAYAQQPPTPLAPPAGPVQELAAPVQPSGAVQELTAPPIAPPEPAAPPQATPLAPTAAAPATAPGVAGQPDAAQRPSALQQPTEPARKLFGPPPARLSVRSGRNVTFGIARQQINRLVTPFAHPVIETTSLAKLTGGADGIIYISTDAYEKVGLFIYNRGNPKAAISLTLVPEDIPQVSTDLNLVDYVPEDEPVEVRSKGDAQLAKGWEADQSYVDTLKQLFRTLAKGEVPDGYAYEEVRRPLNVEHCHIPGVQLQARQLITGYAVRAVVYRAVNVAQIPVTVDETKCDRPDVLAVAAWPSYQLDPGQATELYVAERVAPRESDAVVRPSTLAGAR